MTGPEKADRRSRLATLLDKGNAALNVNARVHANAREARETARQMRENMARVRDRLRDVILSIRPPRFHPISGGSGERPARLNESVWISAAVSDGAACSECGRAIVVGETMYDVVVGGREIRLGSRCGRSYIAQVHSILNNGRPKASDRPLTVKLL